MSDHCLTVNLNRSVLILLLCFISACSKQTTEGSHSDQQHPLTVTTLPVTTFPLKISSNCRDGIANIYDECGSQQLILNDALQAAQKTDKRVLILYGAEWCIWCHVFDRYVKGQSKKFSYQWQYHDGDNLDWTMFEMANKQAEQQAVALNQYFANNFILAHIESYYAPDGEQALADLGYNVDKIVGVPVILVLNTAGEIAAEMKSSKELIGLEIRQDSGREFRGYDRQLLLAELQRMRLAAL